MNAPINLLLEVATSVDSMMMTLKHGFIIVCKYIENVL